MKMKEIVPRGSMRLPEPQDQPIADGVTLGFYRVTFRLELEASLVVCQT